MSPPPGLLLTNLPLLSQRLKSQVDHRLAYILKSNHKSLFAQAAPELNAFRNTTAGLVDGTDDAALCEAFRKTVQLTTYDSYSPLISRFSKTPCRESDVVNLFAPGLPDYIAKSSSTSGGVPKAFPKYNCLPKFDVGARVGPSALPDSPKRTTAFIFHFLYLPLNIIDENDALVKTVKVTFTISALFFRSALGLPPESDEEKMATFVSNFAAPYAAGFIRKWSTFLIIHGLFALGSRSLEKMRMLFVTTFVELIGHMDTYFDMMVDCIANGTIPDLDGIAHIRHHIESATSPDPERAAELRKIGPPSSQPGWCSLAWPNLCSITCVASGSFASSVPLAQSYLGPNVKLHCPAYGSTEGIVALPYDRLHLNRYKLDCETVTELLDFSKSESIGAIVQPWEVEVGKRYEVVMTNSDGLWRYRLGDVVEVTGFDPNDGTPVIGFVERRSVAIRFEHFMISEEELRSAMAFVAKNTLGNVTEWTTTLDERQVPRTIGFFVELPVEQVCDASLVGVQVINEISRSNGNVQHAFAAGSLGKPTVWIVERGTFSAFRQLRLDEGINSIGQIKVPVVLPKPHYVTWFMDRVLKEL